MMTTRNNDIRSIRPNGIAPKNIGRIIGGELRIIPEIRKIINGKPVIVWKIGESSDSTSGIFIIRCQTKEYNGRHYIIIPAFESVGHEGTVDDGNGNVQSYNSSEPLTLWYDVSGIYTVTIDCPINSWENSLISGTYIYALQFPDTLTSLNAGFNNCRIFTDINLKNVEFIGSTSFFNCMQNYSGESYSFAVNAPNVKRIESYASLNYGAFMRNSAISAVNLPECEFIGSCAFKNCSQLTSVNIPKVKRIERMAFSQCYKSENGAYTGLEEIEIPSTIEYIASISGAGAFYDSRALKKIKIHKPVGSIEGAPWGAPSSAEIQWLG